MEYSEMPMTVAQWIELHWHIHIPDFVLLGTDGAAGIINMWAHLIVILVGSAILTTILFKSGEYVFNKLHHSPPMEK